MKCKVCSRDADVESEYCEHHAKAYENILAKFETWKKVLDISWKEYLDEILRNPLTGAWAKEVIQCLVSKTS